MEFVTGRPRRKAEEGAVNAGSDQNNREALPADIKPLTRLESRYQAIAVGIALAILVLAYAVRIVPLGASEPGWAFYMNRWTGQVYVVSAGQHRAVPPP